MAASCSQTFGFEMLIAATESVIDRCPLLKPIKHTSILSRTPRPDQWLVVKKPQDDDVFIGTGTVPVYFRVFDAFEIIRDLELFKKNSIDTASLRRKITFGFDRRN